MTCIEDYYVEELLYAPEEELEKTQKLLLIVQTINDVCNKNPIMELTETVNIKVENGDEEKDCPGEEVHLSLQGNHVKQSSQGTDIVLDLVGEGRAGDFTNCKPQLLKDHRNNDGELLEHDSKNVNSNTQDNVRKKQEVTHKEKQGMMHRETDSSVEDILSSETPFILDIDMDFFSTRNPFKDLFTEVSY